MAGGCPCCGKHKGPYHELVCGFSEAEPVLGTMVHMLSQGDARAYQVLVVENHALYKRYLRWHAKRCTHKACAVFGCIHSIPDDILDDLLTMNRFHRAKPGISTSLKTFSTF